MPIKNKELKLEELEKILSTNLKELQKIINNKVLEEYALLQTLVKDVIYRIKLKHVT